MKKVSSLITILAIIICLAALGYVGWVFWSSRDLTMVGQKKAEAVISGLNLPADRKLNLPYFLKGRTSWPGFEGQFGTVRVVNKTGEAITDWVPLQATSDWMVAGSHDFLAQLPTGNHALYTEEARLEFRNENPSGESAQDEVFSQLIKLAN